MQVRDFKDQLFFYMRNDSYLKNMMKIIPPLDSYNYDAEIKYIDIRIRQKYLITCLKIEGTSDVQMKVLLSYS